MNKSQRIIVLRGRQSSVEEMLNILEGFKACTVVRGKLTAGKIANIFRHNKNALVSAKNVDFEDIRGHNPIWIDVSTFEKTGLNPQRSLEEIIKDFENIVDRYDTDVGDHEIYDSKNVTEKVNCLMCAIAERKNEKKEYILYETPNFFVTPGTGAFCKGYCMIVPKSHVMSLAMLSEKEFIEFMKIFSDMKFLLQSIYKEDVFAFECGTARDGGGKHATSIVHAHFHLTVTDMPVLENIQDSGVYPTMILPDDLWKKYGEHSYMLYIDQQDQWYISSDPATYYPRQHPRQVLADYMGLKKGEYNWRKYPHRDRLRTIAMEFQEFIKNNLDALPPNIIEATKSLQEEQL